MKLASIFFCFVLILGIIPLLGQDNVPAISFESLTKNFGKVTEGEVLKAVFKFVNKGSVPLDIIKVEPS